MKSIAGALPLWALLLSPGLRGGCWRADGAASALGPKLLRDLNRDRDRDARLGRLARSVNGIVDRYLGTRAVVMFADEVARSELGRRLLADMGHPRLLVSRVDPRLANGLIVYLQRPDGGGDRPHEYYDALLARLPASDHSRHMVLWDDDGAAGPRRVDLYRVQNVFEAFWHHQLVDVAALVPVSTGSVRVYTYNPYAGTRCDEAGPPVMVNVWSGWTGAFLRPDPVFGLDGKLNNLHKYAAYTRHTRLYT